MKTLATSLLVLATATLAGPTALVAQNAPTNLLPGGQDEDDAPEEIGDGDADDAVTSSRVAPATETGPVEMTSEPVVQKFDPVVQQWNVAQAQELVAAIEGIGSPMDNRTQWFVMDPDADRYRSGAVLKQALETGDIVAAIEGVAPLHPDYEALRSELAEAKPGSKRHKLVQANMDRWRWLPRDLGHQYLITNVPEYQLRLTVNDKIMRTYRTIVGKPGRTATPQLAESVEGVILNPNWTVPQSIVKGENLGARVLANPSWASSKGYKATKGANGYISVVQGPGPGNALGRMKLDMPNRHAIFFHDTPSRGLFSQSDRALSHGCIRTERATELAFTLAILQAGLTGEEAADILASGEYTRVEFNSTMPAYITYFTMGTNIDGEMATFKDIYDRDAPVLAAFEAPRKANRSRVTDEEIIEIVNDRRDIA